MINSVGLVRYIRYKDIDIDMDAVYGKDILLLYIYPLYIFSFLFTNNRVVLSI